MKIIRKYYDNNGKLKTLEDKSKNNLYSIRVKVLKNKKEFPCCDFEGKCTNILLMQKFILVC